MADRETDFLRSVYLMKQGEQGGQGEGVNEAPVRKEKGIIVEYGRRMREWREGPWNPCATSGLKSSGKGKGCQLGWQRFLDLSVRFIRVFHNPLRRHDAA